MTSVKRKPYIKPTLPVTDKEKIIELAEDYLLGDNNEFVVMNDFIHNDMQCPEPHGNANFIGDIAHKMRNTGKYELKETNNRYVVYKKEKKPWGETNPGFDKVRTGLITALFSLIVGWLLFQLNNRGQLQIDNRQNESLSRKSDSLKILEKKIKVLEDTLATHKPR